MNNGKGGISMSEKIIRHSVMGLRKNMPMELHYLILPGKSRICMIPLWLQR